MHVSVRAHLFKRIIVVSLLVLWCFLCRSSTAFTLQHKGHISPHRCMTTSLHIAGRSISHNNYHPQRYNTRKYMDVSVGGGGGGSDEGYVSNEWVQMFKVLLQLYFLRSFRFTSLALAFILITIHFTPFHSTIAQKGNQVSLSLRPLMEHQTKCWY